ncbi:hypothetical protein [Crateriforma conspicua]|uniref:hypothetical protein n=1 Tax=Crateriforma TaxID=2714592 RepID=UPI0018CD53D3|nr:hypothetical protein [Crateriforma conspicua]
MTTNERGSFAIHGIRPDVAFVITLVRDPVTGFQKAFTAILNQRDETVVQWVLKR